MASLPGMPGSLGLPTANDTANGSAASGGISGGSVDNGPGFDQGGSITIVNSTQLSSFPGHIPATTDGNTLVVIMDLGLVPDNVPQSRSTSIYINSTGTPIGTDLVGRTVYDGTSFYSADFGPSSTSDLTFLGGSGNPNLFGIGIFYLENIPSGITEIQSPPSNPSFPPDPSFPWRVAVYELSPCVFDDASAAFEVSSVAGVETWSGIITPSGTDAIAFAQFSYGYPSWGSGAIGASWPIDMALTPAVLGSTYNPIVCIQSGISGATPFSVSVASPSVISTVSMACFKPRSAPSIRMVDKQVSFSGSGSVAIRTTLPGDLIVAIGNSSATVVGTVDTFTQAGVSGDVSIWYAVSIGGETAISFSSVGGMAVFELESDLGSFVLVDVESAAVSALPFGAIGVEYDGPSLTGTSGACAYFMALDTGISQLLLSPDWKFEPFLLGSVVFAYSMLNRSGLQQMNFFVREDISAATTRQIIGVAFCATTGTGGGGSDLDQFLPNVWIVS